MPELQKIFTLDYPSFGMLLLSWCLFHTADCYAVHSVLLKKRREFLRNTHIITVAAATPFLIWPQETIVPLVRILPSLYILVAALTCIGVIITIWLQTLIFTAELRVAPGSLGVWIFKVTFLAAGVSFSFLAVTMLFQEYIRREIITPLMPLLWLLSTEIVFYFARAWPLAEYNQIRCKKCNKDTWFEIVDPRVWRCTECQQHFLMQKTGILLARSGVLMYFPVLLWRAIYSRVSKLAHRLLLAIFWISTTARRHGEV